MKFANLQKKLSDDSPTSWKNKARVSTLPNEGWASTTPQNDESMINTVTNAMSFDTWFYVFMSALVGYGLGQIANSGGLVTDFQNINLHFVVKNDKISDTSYVTLDVMAAGGKFDSITISLTSDVVVTAAYSSSGSPTVGRLIVGDRDTSIKPFSINYQTNKNMDETLNSIIGMYTRSPDNGSDARDILGVVFPNVESWPLITS